MSKKNSSEYTYAMPIENFSKEVYKKNWVSPLDLTDIISLGGISMMRLTLGDDNDYRA